MQLRYYQEEAKQAVRDYFIAHRNKNPCVVLPTGAGKTPLLASICQDAVAKGSRVLVVSHVKELLEQSRNTLQLMCPNISVGLYSSGLGRKDTSQDVIVAGVQSIYKTYYKLGKIDLIIVDEAHLIPPDGDGMYRQLLNGLKEINRKVRLVGLTATPYRMKTGKLCTANGFLNDVCYEANVKTLIEQGYLSRLETRLVDEGEFNTTGLHIRMGEYVAAEVDELVNKKEKIEAACREVVSKMKKFNRKKVLIFASNVKHAEAIKIIIEGLSGETCGIILGSTDKRERERTISLFKSGEIKYLVNVDVLTTGFDVKDVDVVVLLRPTASPGLYYQMVGRGLRTAEGKDYCLILDFGQNIVRHGPIDMINADKKKKKKDGVAPFKYCPSCKLGCHASVRVCPECGYKFPEQEQDKKITVKSSRQSVISKDITETRYDILSVMYYKEHARNSLYPYVLVCYTTKEGKQIKDHLFISGSDSNVYKFENWWKAHSNYPVPENVDSVIKAAKDGIIYPDSSIVVRKEKGSKYHRIIKYEVHKKENEVLVQEKMPIIPCWKCNHYGFPVCEYSGRQLKDSKSNYKYIHPSCQCCVCFEKRELIRIFSADYSDKINEAIKAIDFYRKEGHNILFDRTEAQTIHCKDNAVSKLRSIFGG